MSNNDNKFTIADLQKWVEEGLISPEQGTSIRSYLESSGSVEEQDLDMPEQRKGLNFISLAYYFGSFMILLAYTIFMGLEWETLGFPLQITVSLGTIGVLWALGSLSS